MMRFSVPRISENLGIKNSRSIPPPPPIGNAEMTGKDLENIKKVIRFSMKFRSIRQLNGPL